MLVKDPKYYIWKTRLLSIVNPKRMHNFDSHIAGKSVLDIGCGPSPSFYSFGTAKTVVGIDNSIVFIHHSRSLAEKNPSFQNNYFYINGEAQNLPFKDGQFQVGIFVFALHHIPVNHNLLIKEAVRCCSEKIIIIDHVQDEKGLRRIIKYLWWKLADRGVQYNTYAEWKKLLKSYKIAYEDITGFPLYNVYNAIISLKG
jgi:ubiquinone/menaquinone biosynthesis C-methylase UbiE